MAVRPSERRALGRLGEELAARHLCRLGYRIVARNVHVRGGELDLVALEGRALCFVEVRLRSSRRFGGGAGSVDWRKRRRIVRAAAALLATRRLPPHDSVRFDVVAVDASGDPPQLELIRDAFGAGS